MGTGVGVGRGVAVGGIGVGVGGTVVAVGAGVAVAVGSGRGVGVSAGTNVGKGSGVRLTSDAQADRMNNNAAIAKVALIDFIYRIPLPHIKIAALGEKARPCRSITRKSPILHE